MQHIHEKRGYNKAINEIIRWLEQDLRNPDMFMPKDVAEFVKEFIQDLRMVQK